MMINEKVACEFIRHETGINEYIFHESSRQAVNEFMVHNDELAYNTPEDEVSLVLIDISPSGLPPLAYFLSKVREAQKKYPYRLSSRVAVVYTDSRLLGLMDNTVRLLTSTKDIARFFKLEQRDQAYDWLLGDE